MTDQIAYQEYIQRRYNAFCKTVIRCAALDKILKLKRQWERQVSLDYLMNEKAREGDPEAVNAVLLHYAGYIRYFSKVNGQVNAEVEDYVKQRLIDCQFKFRLDEPPDKS